MLIRLGVMSRPEDWLRPELHGLAPYQVADARGLIKLDAMENPYPLPAEVGSGWARALAAVAVNRYPDGGAARLKAQLGKAMALPTDSGLLLGNGSDELLQIMMLALARPGACMLTPEPGFAMFRLIARTAGLRYVGVALGKDFALDAEAMVAAIEAERPALVLVAQPNNPSGNAFDPRALRRVVAAAPGAVVIDEAYVVFADEHCLAWLAEYPNLMILRTLSKLGLAGLRLGFLIAARPWIDALEGLRLPYNLNAFTQAAGALALEHYPAFLTQAKQICAERGRLADALALVPGLQVYPSQANFLLVRVLAGQAPDWHRALRARGVLVKNLADSHPQVAGCLRITVGTPAENDALVAALRAIAVP